MFGGLLGTGGADNVSLVSSKSSSYTTIETAKAESTNLALAVIMEEYSILKLNKFIFCFLPNSKHFLGSDSITRYLLLSFNILPITQELPLNPFVYFHSCYNMHYMNLNTEDPNM